MTELYMTIDGKELINPYNMGVGGFSIDWAMGYTIYESPNPLPTELSLYKQFCEDNDLPMCAVDYTFIDDKNNRMMAWELFFENNSDAMMFKLLH